MANYELKLAWSPEVPEQIQKLVPYTPGKPIEETERELGITGVVKLASNENPLGISRAALDAALAAAQKAHLYPDGSHYELKNSLATHLNVSAQELSIGSGSNEFIDLLPRAFVAPNRNLITHQYAFIAYKLCAALQGCQCIEVPVDSNFSVDVEHILKAVNANTRLVILANPNNPTGSVVAPSDLERLASELANRNILLVLDYAYWEYVSSERVADPMALYRKYPNVIVLRTFSKIYGLAGLRVGYAIARPAVISTIERVRQPFNVSAVALSAAVAALSDQEHVVKSRLHNQRERSAIVKFLKQFDYRVIETEGNFVVLDLESPASQWYEEFLREGVILRPLGSYGLSNYMRISVGLESENQKFFDAASKLFGEAVKR